MNKPKALFIAKEELEIICRALHTITYEGINEKREEIRQELVADLEEELKTYVE